MGLFRAKSAPTADRLENGRLEKGNEVFFKYLYSMKTQGNSMEIHIDGRTLYDVAGRHDLVKDQIIRASHEANV